MQKWPWQRFQMQVSLQFHNFCSLSAPQINTLVYDYIPTKRVSPVSAPPAQLTGWRRNIGFSVYKSSPKDEAHTV